MDSVFAKRAPLDLALSGGRHLATHPPSGPGPGGPRVEAFLSYSREFFDSHQFTNAGPLSRALERRLAELHDTEHCVTFASGFWALVVAIKGVALPGRSEVVMPGFLSRRLADPVAWAGLTPRFCEVDPETLAICPTTAERCISEDSALLLAVHPVVGRCDAAGLEGLAEAYGVPLLIDAVDCCYRAHQGRRVGSFGGGEIFSLHADGTINGLEGGYLTTNDGELARRVYLMRGFGFNGPDNVEHLGLNAKLNEIHAAMALASLDELDARVRSNRRRYDRYRLGLGAVEGASLRELGDSAGSYCQHVVVELTHEWRTSMTATIGFLNSRGIPARPYSVLQHNGTAYPTLSNRLPHTEALAEHLILLPCGPQVTDADIDATLGLFGLLARRGMQTAVGA